MSQTHRTTTAQASSPAPATIGRPAPRQNPRVRTCLVCLEGYSCAVWLGGLCGKCAAIVDDISFDREARACRELGGCAR